MSASELEDLIDTLTASRPAVLCRERARLEVVAGEDLGLHHEFEGRVRLGSSKLADVVLRDPRISALHCEISAGTRIRIRDLGSTNGTFLGNLQIVEAFAPSGESFLIGKTRVRVVALDEVVELPLPAATSFFGLVGRSAAMREVISQIELLAPSEATVLVQGETGTGKELVAEALHLASPRVAGPLVIVDCGALSYNLVEAELFGYERGAFTGASQRTVGAIERADGGTLFLDEIGELPRDLQPKLLRALESGQVKRLGGDRWLSVRARVVAATHRDLALEVTRGRFREDLYYRLAVGKIAVPPLRERRDDIPLLAIHILRDLGIDPASCLTARSLAALAQHDWPGNVRELKNVLARAAILSRPPLPEGAPAEASLPTVNLSIPLREGKQRLVEAYERAYVTALLRECGGNISEAARRAHMDRMSIHRILQRLGLDRGEG